ncbi:DUF2946 domain-containing protein [Paraburkholderia sp. SARCC-3016]|uniref:DUF2946 domain-containing protein n=1 Tax=Paraburkholderia sp. SARCC-3016 TaxID=3058611 RepID=UPI002808B098|nr:DUF2946 domain-containing protein [Paraburkholderia sp. SARCC-3016]MDQ7980654.1 DUF2946 domain-containing protein [Paraburkholderia sp. SARCC-3016]
MTFHARRRFSAWLGMLAICLVVFVPVVSQLVASAHASEPLAALCSATQPDAGTHHAGDPLSACGYCDLLATHAAPPPVAPAVEPVLLLPVVAAATVLSTRFTPLGAFASGRPRAPPVFS